MIFAYNDHFRTHKKDSKKGSEMMFLTNTDPSRRRSPWKTYVWGDVYGYDYNEEREREERTCQRNRKKLNFDA